MAPRAVGRALRALRHRGAGKDAQDLLSRLIVEQQERMGLVLAENQRLRETPEHRRYDAMQWLFILTYGRSGSTLLQGILTRTPGVLIRGENGGILSNLFRYHTTAIHERDRLSAPGPREMTHAWAGIDGYPADLALRSMRNLFCDTILRPHPDTRVAGYKEIRWPKELHEFADFIRQVFPGARFILNTRDLEQVARSGWWPKMDDPLTHLRAEEQRLRELADSLGDACFHIHYNDYVDDPSRIEPLFEWAGLPYDARRVHAALERPHSYNNKTV